MSHDREPYLVVANKKAGAGHEDLVAFIRLVENDEAVEVHITGSRERPMHLEITASVQAVERLRLHFRDRLIIEPNSTLRY